MTAEQIEAFLLARFVPTALGGDDGEDSRQATDAKRWLGNLAEMINDKRATLSSQGRGAPAEIAWWELSATGHRSIKILAGLLAAGTAGTAVGLAFHVLFGLGAGLLVGGLTAVLLGAVSALTAPPPPKDIEVRLAGRFAPMLLSGLAIGGIVMFFGTIVRDIGFGAGLGIAFGFLIAALYGTTGTDPTARPADPLYLLRREKRVGFLYGLAYGVFSGLVGYLLSHDLALSVALGIFSGLAGGLLQGPIWWISGRGAPGVTALGHLWIASLYFWWRKKLPLDVMGFLEKAHDAGVLRISGSAYEFRHPTLQNVLLDELHPERSGEPRPDPSTPAAAFEVE
jgi:hypothetical protein